MGEATRLTELLESARWGVLRYLLGEALGALSKGVNDKSGMLDERLMKEFLAEPANRSSLLGFC